MKKKDNLLKVWPKILKADKDYCKRTRHVAPLNDWFAEYLNIDFNSAPLMSKEDFINFLWAMPANDPWRKKLMKVLKLNDKHPKEKHGPKETKDKA